MRTEGNEALLRLHGASLDKWNKMSVVSNHGDRCILQPLPTTG